ncbi:hypothetical protein KSP40_PGU016126 [Platanthera guangdongensis]|uniref:Uncharacterized protein n=1 Tax=Platanthera guangdongensis TaxID=2320717 RepID=A0ABR2LIV4_9ASPA
MADAWFLSLILFLLYIEEDGGARYMGGDGDMAGDAGPPKILLVNGFGALASAVGLASRPASGDPWIVEGCFYLVLLLLLLLGLAQLFLYAAAATAGGAAAGRRVRGLVAALSIATVALLLAPLAIMAGCVFGLK